MTVIQSMSPVIGDRPKVLILGSIPGVQSLQTQQYYGNPRNHFWPIMFTLLDVNPIQGYEERLNLLKRNQIALWDVIGSCEREGSLDSKIKNAIPNPIETLLKEHPSIQLIACNGTKSYQTFKRHFKYLMSNYDVKQLPSTSPVPGKYNKSYDEKVVSWQVINEYVT
ncbi:DNA-deoxyinosine glycosylase [Halalkalibacillus halophilus]|uniref:DNA-deoxyinosine glycosylase n=1 Tax=Halalkalibacillus halophilus TaxID=392827 RepID=UPI00040AE974|nr:DNA-deoxyinosine glycosylase [Halalkalibacillus halophilus]